MIPGDDRRAREVVLARERAARAEAASLQFIVIILAVLLATITVEYIHHLSMLIKNCNLYRTSDSFDQLRNRTNLIIG